MLQAPELRGSVAREASQGNSISASDKSGLVEGEISTHSLATLCDSKYMAQNRNKGGRKLFSGSEAGKKRKLGHVDIKQQVENQTSVSSSATGQGKYVFSVSVNFPLLFILF